MRILALCSFVTVFWLLGPGDIDLRPDGISFGHKAWADDEDDGDDGGDDDGDDDGDDSGGEDSGGDDGGGSDDSDSDSGGDDSGSDDGDSDDGGDGDDRDDGDDDGSDSDDGDDGDDRDDDEDDDRDEDDEDDRDDEDDTEAEDEDRAASPNRALPADIPRLSYGRDDSDRRRDAEISAAGVPRSALSTLRGAGFTVIRQSNSVLLPNTLTLRLRVPSGRTPQQALALARNAVPDAVFDFSHLFGPSQASTYARGLVGMQRPEKCTSQARIGMIDGAVARHRSLRGVPITRKSFVDGREDTSHGTAIASVLMGRDPSGSAPLKGARLYAASVFELNRNENIADAVSLVEALDWMAAKRVRFVNISIAGPRNDVLHAAVEAAARRGMVLVAAAGNAGARGPARFPAAFPEVIAVSAVDKRGRPYVHGNRGRYIDVAAPGVDVWGARAGGNGALWSGTSFAAPFVTMALSWRDQSQSIRNVNDARAFLAREARDLGPNGRDSIYGVGLVQIKGC